MKSFNLKVLASLMILSIGLIGCVANDRFLREPSESSSLPSEVLNNSAVLAWANEAVVAINSYNFANYQESFQNASRYFTPGGWAAYRLALNSQGSLNEVVNKKLVVSAVASGSPILLEQGLVGESYSWKVQVPVLITYENTKGKSVRHALITMLIVRTPQGIGTKGLGIDQYIANVENQSVARR